MTLFEEAAHSVEGGMWAALFTLVCTLLAYMGRSDA